jgi:hypothetical protein
MAFMGSGLLKCAAVESVEFRKTLVWSLLGAHPILLAGLVAVEMFIGMAFLVGTARRVAAVAAIVLLAAGSVAVAVEKSRADETGERAIACGCLGAGKGEASGLSHVLTRNGLLAAGVLLCLGMSSPRGKTLERCVNHPVGGTVDPR